LSTEIRPNLIHGQWNRATLKDVNSRDKRKGPETKMPKHEITVTINERQYRGEVEARMLLSDFIRDDLGLTGTHVGCEHGVCGACTVLLNGEPVRSCLIFAVQANGAQLKTVEGLAPSESELHPLQQKFWELHGLQCGFCTPGILLTAEALLSEHSDPSENEIREWISGNLCRCTGYQNIIAAIQEAAKKLNFAKS
jgi:aerobic-type carbon monoxide dehydrogenase small subunit (CoxS/CutS family)